MTKISTNVNSLIKFFEYFQKHKWTVTISTLLLIIVIFMFHYLGNIMIDINRLNHEIGATVRIEMDKKESDIMRKSITAEDSFAPIINQSLEEIKNYTHADRVYVMEFHNGSRMMTGYHPRRMTVTYELSNSEPIAKFFQGTPITLYWMFYENLKNNEYLGFPNIDSLQYARGAYLTFKEFGTKSTYIYRICNITDNSVIGFVGIDFLNQNQMNEREMLYVQACMFRIRQAFTKIVIIMDVKK